MCQNILFIYILLWVTYETISLFVRTDLLDTLKQMRLRSMISLLLFWKKVKSVNCLPQNLKVSFLGLYVMDGSETNLKTVH